MVDELHVVVLAGAHTFNARAMLDRRKMIGGKQLAPCGNGMAQQKKKPEE